MNRKARRAGLKSPKFSINAALADDRGDAPADADLIARARLHRERGQPDQAQDICNKILAREPSHILALNLLGLILQESGRHRLAVKTLTKAIAADALNAACHYNIAASYQALNLEADAAVHFKKAIALGMRLKNTEDLILRNPAITTCVDHIEERWPLPVTADELFARHSMQSIANDTFLRCALETILIRGAPLERFLTFIRSALLHFAVTYFGATDDAIVRLFCSIAQQCFINEYVYAQSDEETRQSEQLRDMLLQRAASGEEIPSLLLAAVAAYFPLHCLPGTEELLHRDWPGIAAALVSQQLREPLEEAADRRSIPSLTTVDDSVSLQVMHQYEENPYPRWTINPMAAFADGHEPQIAGAADSNPRAKEQILIAGCGSGQHAFEVAQRFPDADVMAVDISLPSLAYAHRKTREEGLRNIEYAQADILKLGSIGRSFDRIEAIGVLHHLAEPEAGWRILLRLLQPNGDMRVGLYSETARRAIVGVRSLIAERGYRPTPHDIRRCRHEILRDFDERGWRKVIESADFYSISGCRDLLFNVMEHRFTIPRIKTFLNEEKLAFRGFDLEPWIVEKFQDRFPGADTLRDLDNWHAFEADNPQTFRYLYVFTVRKDQLGV
jgi:ubiquinone/menaquinone biosynthesis C-methylase UbiE/tetratricopeptide (TPR) repeat protein